jgi:hypothetical protein
LDGVFGGDKALEGQSDPESFTPGVKDMKQRLSFYDVRKLFLQCSSN